VKLFEFSLPVFVTEHVILENSAEDTIVGPKKCEKFISKILNRFIFILKFYIHYP